MLICYLTFDPSPLSVDLQSDRARKLDHGHPLGLRRGLRSAASPRGHGASAAGGDTKAGAEDRHG